jgi:hypothetical protein
MSTYDATIETIISNRAISAHVERVTEEEVKSIFAQVCADQEFRGADLHSKVYETFLRAAHTAEMRASADPNIAVVNDLGNWVTLKIHGQVAQIWRTKHVKGVAEIAALNMRRGCLNNYNQRPAKNDVVKLFKKNGKIPKVDTLECVVLAVKDSLALVA